MRQLLTFIFGVIATMAAMANTQFADESINYKVMYKWGLINKRAGDVTLSINTSGDHYITQLTARSASWADMFYSVRDTLNGIVLRDGFKPLRYENIAHEGGDFKHDIITYQHQPGKIIANASHSKTKKGKKPEELEQEFESEGVAMDMLSVFYYMRHLDYPSMTTGDKTIVDIFSGKRKETLTINYDGIKEVKIDDTKHKCYHITFTFTSKGGKKTSDNMDAWISTDNNRIPMKLEGKLPVGKVQCFYTGSN